MIKLVKHITLWVLLCLAATAAMGQDYKEMRAEIKQKQKTARAEIQDLNDQIDQYQERLDLAERKYERLYNQYEDLKRVIALQEKKISKLVEEQNHIKEEIAVISDEIETNEEQLAQLIENYKKTLKYIYKHGRTSQLALIFSSASINQMLVRSYYLEKFEEYRQKQAEQIKEKQAELKLNKSQLEEAQTKNEDILAEIQAEKAEQEEKRAQQEKNVALLQENKEQIQAELKRKQREKEKLDNTLTSYVLEEQRIRKAQEELIQQREAERKRRLAEAAAIQDSARRISEMEKYSTPITIAEEGYISDSRLEEIESSFQSQKGSLSWPVESSTISEHFGRKRHPVYGTITPSLGIEIITDRREEVRVVHPGKVIAIQPFSGYGDVVMVKHGRFITAYGNLSQVLVQKNTILQKGDIIGLAGDENSVRGKSLFFLVRESKTNLDPEKWLSSK
ncbi:MAG: peptidoglycan DD-metalloendopeptidase family protein [Balneolaceae bacterium]|nr:peptidoglycan DD-metalloendopeptidase family protein [Balneolaceae bacterium]